MVKSGGVIIKMSYKANLQHFEAPCVENDLGRLNQVQIEKQQVFTNRANAAYAYVRENGIPEGYAETIEVYKMSLYPDMVHKLYKRILHCNIFKSFNNMIR